MADPVVTWNDIVERCETMGVLAKKLYVVFTSPAEGLGKVMENLEQHLAYQHEIEQNGIMFAAGPFATLDDVFPGDFRIGHFSSPCLIFEG